ncbi:MAG: hypothetical protein OJF59_002452 [Cytophagales bacterium]|jgi:Fe-S-cluster containining protein|nr:YkgJ family cysteine cluster protein [Bacteroidota bacterium]MBS1980183.1 YkgJ family cysteine cluster protein [Bacteroidota bacterium]WHZ08698.1 MAG: hypothetical protein OJF59_002452 [Cytophagales bacterium]
MDSEQFGKRSKAKSTENKKFLQQLKRVNWKTVDDFFHRAHEEVFAETDCLACANCCKTTSPIFYPVDIDRASQFLKMKPGDFVSKYLTIDSDDDYVLKKSPCVFLGADNYCSIYEARPKACREYPHTNRKKMVQIMDLTYKNTLVCPAVLEMVERMKLNKEFILK